MENFIKFFNSNPTLKVSASGRVNLIGEHIDYCGGKVLPVSINLSSKVYSKINGSNVINLAFKGKNEIISLKLDNISNYEKLALGSYQAGCISKLIDLGYNIKGMDMYFDCDIPFGGGLSSSAGIEVSTMVTALIQNGYNYDNKKIALLCQDVENNYCHVNCGIMDQFASSNGKKNMAMLLDCKKVECEYIPCDFGEYSLLVCNCNKPHSLIKSEYNTRRKEVEEGLNILKQYKKDLECLADLSLLDYELIENSLTGKIKDRVTHIVTECDRVNKAVKCLKNNQIREFGKLLNESHYSLRDNYEITGKELDTLSELMRNNPYCIGARMTGAGFGGCCICLVEKGKEENLKTECVSKYEEIIGYKPTFYDITIEDGIKIEFLSTKI